MSEDQTPAHIPAVSRSALQHDGLPKSDKWPRTLRRQQRVEGVLANRQPGLTVVLEDVHDPHNAGAVLRSCDAVGVLDLHVVYVNDPPPTKALRQTSGSAARWINITFHDSIPECYAALRAQGNVIYTLALGHDAVDLYAANLAQPVALVFGNEQRGVTEEAQELADGSILIPMRGMVESLNISVACAVTLYEAMRQRQVAGLYDAPQLDELAREALTEAWLKR